MAKHAGYVTESIFHGSVWEEKIARWICLHKHRSTYQARTCGDDALSFFRRFKTTPPGRSAYGEVSHLFDHAIWEQRKNVWKDEHASDVS
jgi:hypothetical protein